MAELGAGRKRSHWIWYIFPQIAGLGHSEWSRKYAIADVDEARAYLRDPTLKSRLAQAVAVAHEQIVVRGTSVEELMGSRIDAAKVVSSLTLFSAVARTVTEDDELAALADHADAILRATEEQGLPPCTHTRSALERFGFASFDTLWRAPLESGQPK